MEKQTHRTRVGSRVRIKDTVTPAYRMARVYMEGEVKALRHDEYGYPLIFVKWDRNHWAYSGEHDGWTMESHFDLIEGPSKVSEDDRTDKLLSALGNLVEQFTKEGAKEETSEAEDADPEVAPDLEEDNEGTFEQRLERAFEEAKGAEAFILIAAMKDELGDREIVVPYLSSGSRQPDALTLLEAIMSDIGAQAHAQLALKEIKRLREDES